MSIGKKINFGFIVLFLGVYATVALAETPDTDSADTEIGAPTPVERIVNTNEFSDVDDNVEILYLAEFDIIKGYPDKTVKSEKILNRAEALTLYARLFNMEPEYDPDCTFLDISPDIWYAGYVSAMCNIGLVEGYPDGTFKGENPINRAEAIKILLLGLGVDLETDFSHLPVDVYPPDWYAPYADYATKRILVPLTEFGKFKGDDLYTRGDLFTNIYRIKRLQELNEEIYHPKLDPVVVDEEAAEEELTEEDGADGEFGTSDLIIRNITVGSIGFAGFYLDIEICNEGESAFFEELKLAINEDYERIISNLTINANECYSTGYYGKIDDQIEVFSVFTTGFTEGENVTAVVDPDDEIDELSEQNNTFSSNPQIPECGNNVCEIGENQGVCPIDCEIPCESEFCNDKVVVFCGCDGRDHLLRACTFSQPCMEDQCGEQVELFDEILEAETKVYDCLADYFDYEPPRIPYIVYAEKTDPCNMAAGCVRPLTNLNSTVHYIMNPSVAGYVPYGEIYTSSPEQMSVDEHEMTHQFLFHMLHSFPAWFNEGVAIQTDSRLDCDLAAHPFPNSLGYQRTWENGKSEVDVEDHLGYRIPSLDPNVETYTASGFWLNDDGSLTFGEDFYRALKAGEVEISPEVTPHMYNALGQLDPHNIGSLFMMGLKLDYNCTEDCVRDIVLKLKEFEDNRCPGPECGIGLMMGTREGEEGIVNAVIKEKTDEVVGEDTGELFELLGLE